MNSKLTVLMSAYNASAFVGRTIESVLNQTYSDFDFVIVENGSTDNTREIIKKYKDSRIVLIELDQNIGLSGAMNLGISKIESKWIAHIDADDLWTNDKLEKQMAFLDQHDDFCALATWIDYIDINDKKIGESREKLTSWKSVEEKYKANKAVVFNHSSIIFNRVDVTNVGGYHGQFWPAEDADLWNRLLETGKKMMILPEALTLYRIFDGANSISKLRQMNMMFRYVKHCMRKRREGKLEPSFDEYKQLNKGFFKNMNETRKDYSIYNYKKAVAAYSGKRMFPFFYRMTLAAIFNPQRILSTLKNKTIK